MSLRASFRACWTSRSGRRASSAVVTAALSLTLVACTDIEEAAPVRATLVSLAPVEQVDLTDRIEASGQLLAIEEADIAAEVTGVVTRILSDEGSFVAEGAAVLEIAPDRRELEVADAEARLAEASAALREARREHKRVESLHERGAASVAQLDSAQAAQEAAQSRQQAAQAQRGLAARALRDAQVKAPFAGRVARRYVSRGEYVRPGDRLFELVAIDPLKVEFHLVEADSGRLLEGAPVLVRVAPFPNEIFRARVSMISPTIDVRTRTLRVEARIENSDGRLRPGLFAMVDLGLEERPGVSMVPEEAVLQRADGPVVFRLDRLDGSNRVQRQVVRTGVYRDGKVEVMEGVRPGDRIVVKGHAALHDGEAVRIHVASDARDVTVAEGNAP
jgi:membrane fusion protein (multidrug efflux system)